MAVPLARPTLRELPERSRWPGAVAVIGQGATPFAERLAQTLTELGVAARVLRVELRHAPGHDVEGDVVHAHPDALGPALEAARASSSAITIGVGLPFAAAVVGDLTVWIRDGGGAPLGPIERAITTEARLVLDEPRLATADALAERLRSGPTRTVA